MLLSLFNIFIVLTVNYVIGERSALTLLKKNINLRISKNEYELYP